MFEKAWPIRTKKSELNLYNIPGLMHKNLNKNDDFSGSMELTLVSYLNYQGGLEDLQFTMTKFH